MKTSDSVHVLTKTNCSTHLSGGQITWKRDGIVITNNSYVGDNRVTSELVQEVVISTKFSSDQTISTLVLNKAQGESTLFF